MNEDLYPLIPHSTDLPVVHEKFYGKSLSSWVRLGNGCKENSVRGGLKTKLIYGA